MLGIQENSFFFKQKRQKRFQQRRVRKFDNSYSLFGDKREGILLFPGEKDNASVITGGGASIWRNKDNGSIITAGGVWRSTESKLGVTRPATASRRVSLVDPAVVFPSIDLSGPRLVTSDQQVEEANETHSILSEKKLEFLQEVEEKSSSRKKVYKLGSIWNLSEAKFASSGILSKLSKALVIVEEDHFEEIILPVDLVSVLSQNYEELVINTVIEKRDWQTDCYHDFHFQSRNKHPFLTNLPKEPVQAENAAAALSSVIANQQEEKVSKKPAQSNSNKRGKRVRMSTEAKEDPDKFRSRPQTARSIASNFSFKSDLSEDGKESTFTSDLDRLPPELLRPGILQYRRESTRPKITSKTPQTRREKARNLLKERDEQLKRVKTKVRPPSAKGMKEKRPATAKGTKEKRPATARQTSRTLHEDSEDAALYSQPKTTINFSVEKTTEKNQNWLVHPGGAEDPESHTLRMWEKKLRELHRKREEASFMDKQRGATKSLVVKFYSDPRIRTLRVKHHRALTVPLPAFFKKLPPSMGSFSSHVANEALMIGEGMKLFVLTLPDGSGHCSYMSGRQAISLSRCDSSGPLRGSKGLYTLVFDDVEGSPLLGYFTPTGRACCYYSNGAIHMLSNRKGGSLFDQDGHVIREWEWPPSKLNLPVSISFHLNVHISFRCTSQTNMDLRVSVKGQGYKFSVGPLLEDLQEFQKTSDLAEGDMQSGAHFISKAAKIRSRGGSTSETESVSGKTRRKKSHRDHFKYISEDEDSQVNGSLPSLLAKGEKFSKQLETFHGKIHTLVNDWMNYYCEKMGIDKPDSPSSRPASRAGGAQRGYSSYQGRLVKSSMSYATGMSHPPSIQKLRHTRSLTHPLVSRQSSRAASPLVPFKFDPAGGVEDDTADSPRTFSPFPSLRPPTPLDRVQRPLSNELHSKPFRVGKAKPAARTSIRPGTGCPVSLHNMLWKDLETMPPCKCDKRRVPFISDLEFDIFLLSHVPKEQLIVISIISSLKEGSCPYEPMINATYTHLNRLRFSPCLQSLRDPFRLLKYDLEQATAGIGPEKPGQSNKPLLVERHNAYAGMILMYMGGKLVYGDYMFNGYSGTKRDFMKQVQNCIHLGKKGQFLPYDFKFTKKTGSKILGPNTWAYPVSGVLQDLIPFTPESDSHSTSRTSSPHLIDVRKISKVITESDELETDLDDSMMGSQLMGSQLMGSQLMGSQLLGSQLLGSITDLQLRKAQSVVPGLKNKQNQ